MLSEITDRIYLSGVGELQSSTIIDEINRNNIGLIISCVKRDYTEMYHNFIKASFPNIIILYLPYDDIPSENLFKANRHHSEQQDGRRASSPPSGWTSQHDKFDYFEAKSTFTQNLAKPYYTKNDTIIYENLPMLDIGYYLMNYFLEHSDQSVLVHCMAGISRSASLLVYYFMKKYGWSYNNAYNFIKRRRSIIQPNTGFEQKLRIYDNYRDKLFR